MVGLIWQKKKELIERHQKLTEQLEKYDKDSQLLIGQTIRFLGNDQTSPVAMRMKLHHIADSARFASLYWFAIAQDAVSSWQSCRGKRGILA